jgi:CubicO group peptidase (beta-lactamase class C family)
MVNERIRHIESGLVEFTTPMDMFEPHGTEKKDRRTLLERMAHYRVPGVSIAVICEYGLEWAKAYGIHQVGSDRVVTTETFFQAASTSKLVTAALVLRLVEQGILDLDQDVNKYLRSWKVQESEFTAEQKVTLRLLLTHQSGLPTTNFDQEPDAGDPTLVQVLNGEPPAMNRPAVVEYTPGTMWQYSNVGFAVIQQILEATTDKPFSRLAQEILFEPLGMKYSTFAYPLRQELRSREAMPHDADGIAREPAMCPTALAHGGLMTTPSDLALFTCELMRAYQGLSSRLLSKQMMRQMLRKELDLDPQMFGLPLGLGLGVLLYGRDENLVFAHPGSNLPGMNCWLLGNPSVGKGAVVMTNGAMGEVLAMEIISAIIREYGWPSGYAEGQG